jgi:hypothetical protein
MIDTNPPMHKGWHNGRVATDTKALIEQGVTRFLEQVPALRQLKLVVHLELRARGDVPTWRVELPGPVVKKDPAGDARVDVEVVRSEFNTLATEGTLKDWVRAYELGHVRVSGDAGVVKLVGNVISRHLARARA